MANDSDGFFFGNVPDIDKIAVPLPRANPNTDGLQEAHLQAKERFNSEFGKLLATIDPNGEYIFHNMASNGVLLPESTAGGMALGANVHNQPQLIGHDLLSYTGVGNSQQFLDVLERNTKTAVSDLKQKLLFPENASPEGQASIRQQIAQVENNARIKFAAFNDYSSKFLLDQKTLDAAGLRDGKTYYSVPFNKNDAQVGTSAFDNMSAAQRLDDPRVRAQFTWDAAHDDPLFQESLRIRHSLPGGPDAQVGDISRQLIAFDADQSRIRYPIGAGGKPEILWTDEIRADILARNYFAHGNASLNAGERQKFYDDMDKSSFDNLKDDILNILKDNSVYGGGRQKPVIFREFFEDLSRQRLALGQHEKLFGELVALESKMRTIDGDLFDRVYGEFKNSINTLDEDLLTGHSFGTKVAARGAVTAIGIIVSGLSIYTTYKAETVETPDKPFANWLAEKAPDFLATLPVGAGLAAAAFLASFNPAGLAMVVILTVPIAYEGFKTFLQNYIVAFGQDPEDDFVPIAQNLLKIYKKLDESTAVKFAAKVFATFAKEALAPIFEKYSPVVEHFGGDSVGFVGQPNNWIAGADHSFLIGNENDNVMLHTGYGDAYGLDGDDWLVGILPQFWEKGKKIGWAPVAGRPDDRALAEKDLFLTLDGGKGVDWVITLGGEKAVTIGGLGRDWIFNSSAGGIIYGDTVTGRDENGNRINVNVKAEDFENSDSIWWWPGVKVMDAQANDVLSFFGLPLTGGSEGVPLIVAGLSGFLGASALDASGSTGQPSKYLTENRVFTDSFAVNMTYVFAKDKYGDLKMGVSNSMTGLLKTIGVGTNVSQTGSGQSLVDDLMLVEHFNVPATVWGYSVAENKSLGLTGAAAAGLVDVPSGTFGMKFLLANPALAALAVLPPIAGLSGSMISYIHKVGAMIDAARRFELAAKWAENTANGGSGGSGGSGSGGSGSGGSGTGGGGTGGTGSSGGAIAGLGVFVLDLDRDGIETMAIGDAGIRFDHDLNMFAEETGWLKGDDGFLVRDRNHNGKIDDGSEFVGSATQSGVGSLRALDSNGDGKITVADAVWSELRVWQDRDEDGITDAGELLTLEAAGLSSITLATTADGGKTPQGTTLTDKGSFTWASGGTGLFYDAMFQTSNVDTRYRGESGTASWLADTHVDARGFGTVVDMAVAMSNDIHFGEVVRAASDAMVVPKLKVLREQAGEALGLWGETLELTRELTPVRVQTIAGKVRLADYGVYHEDASGGFWTLHSGAAILDGQGAVIARASLEDVLAQVYQGGAGFHLEQSFSPSTRGTALAFRDEVPYLTKIVNGRAVILDHGVKQADGAGGYYWQLASGAVVRDALGTVIAAPTLANILASPHAAGTEWRVEEIGFNPYANVPVEAIGVKFVDGKVVDYTVEVTDAQGTFYVWARNLDYAAELQFYYGSARDFNLRNYAVDFDTLVDQPFIMQMMQSQNDNVRLRTAA